MRLRLAIIADDLTGSLDSSVPLAEAGLRVEVALGIEGLDEALARQPDVVVVNTASRALPPPAAALAISRVMPALMQAYPDIIFKKIDSRLKGNIGVETSTIATASARGRVIVAPAVPDQQRFVRDGKVQGRGVPEPLPIAPHFTECVQAIEVIDASAQSDLDTLVAETDWHTALAVGARGLGLALARHLFQVDCRVPFQVTRNTLFAIGSRDPITATQMDALIAQGGLNSVGDAPGGQLPPDPKVALPALLRCTGTPIGDPAMVAMQFARGVAHQIALAQPELLVTGGGDTALAILHQLGIRTVSPRGEIEAGMPWFEIAHAGRSLRCAVKSGGFGTPHSLLNLTNWPADSDGERVNPENQIVQS